MEEILEVVDRTIILGKEINLYRSIENPLFLAKEISGWLGIKNASQMLKQAGVSESQKGVFLKKESSEIPLALADGLNGECRIYNYE